MSLFVSAARQTFFHASHSNTSYLTSRAITSTSTVFNRIIIGGPPLWDKKMSDRYSGPPHFSYPRTQYDLTLSWQQDKELQRAKENRMEERKEEKQRFIHLSSATCVVGLVAFAYALGRSSVKQES